MTARVAVNRIWHHHFGEGIVSTLDNFGKMGELPTNPELLDWLAVEFMDRGWSMKQMHRLIMTSATYKMASEVTDPAALNANSAIDPQDKLLWRYRGAASRCREYSRCNPDGQRRSESADGGTAGISRSCRMKS